MLYPLKFQPIYKDYIWGGRNLEKMGKILHEGNVAESWEISCLPGNESIVSNGALKGLSILELIKKYGSFLIGMRLPWTDIGKLPLMVKFLDASENLSVQVHPEDSYAWTHENGELGKNEVLYIISAEKGAKLIYGLVPGMSKELFRQAVIDNKMESCFEYIDVAAGDVLNIPAGAVHAIGKGIVLAEIEQNSNLIYRIHDYNRVDQCGDKRPLHIEKALEAIDFNLDGLRKYNGLKINLKTNSSRTYKTANQYYSVEMYHINGDLDEYADGSRFYIYVFIDGEGEISYKKGTIKVKKGETVLIPALLGHYTLSGEFKALRSYVPDISENVVIPLRKAGYTEEEIYNNVSGLMQYEKCLLTSFPYALSYIEQKAAIYK